MLHALQNLSVYFTSFNNDKFSGPLGANTTKSPNTVKRQMPTICLIVFVHFVGLALKEVVIYY